MVERVTVPTDDGLDVVCGVTTANEVEGVGTVIVGYVTVGNVAVFAVEEVGGDGGTKVDVGVPMLMVAVAVVVVVDFVVVVESVGGGGGTQVEVEGWGGGAGTDVLDVVVTGQIVVLTGIVTVVMTVL